VLRKRKAQSRDAAATRSRILAAGLAEFSTHGYEGGRIERIGRRAGANLRMIYHYFGSKQDLYVAVLEQVYSELRAAERALNLSRLPPREALRALIDFTFDYFASHPEFIGLATGENLVRARYLKRSTLVPLQISPTLAIIKDLLNRGARSGVFRRGVDPVQFFVSLHALCYLHLSNRHSLSVMFQRDLGERRWLAERRRHVREVLAGFLLL
jgi:TetR/AcrR family transcriptional regulator